MEYVMGIDVGTTAVKVLLIDSSGQSVIKSSRDYQILLPAPGWVEQDPEAVWAAVKEAAAEALGQIPNRRTVRGIALSTQRDTLVCVDGENRPLRPAMTWMDGRAAPQCRRLEQEIGAERVYEITGVGVSPIWTFAFLLWLREEEPSVFQRAACFGLVHDFILCRLGAKEHYLDASNACQTMLFDYRAGAWSKELLAYGGLSEDRLPRLVEPGARVGVLSPALAGEWGLGIDTALVSGGGDQQCAALGAGAVRHGDVEAGIGTAANLLAATAQPVSDPHRRLICHRAALPGGWILEGAMLAAGKVVEWLRREICGGADLAEIDREVRERSRPGAGGLVLLPHLEGVASPYWNPDAGGVIHGISLSTTRADLARCVLEGVCLEIRKNIDLLAPWDLVPQRLLVSGGAGRSAVWMQLLADITGVPVEVPAQTDCAALGAAILAGTGCGLFPDAAKAAVRLAAVGARYRPDEGVRELYGGLLQRSEALYAALESAGLNGRIQRAVG